MVKEVRTQDNPVLNKPCRRINNIDGVTKSLVKELIETMYANHGIGLAANQVGYGLQMAIVTNIESLDAKPFVMINPKVLDISKELVTLDEGCLSLIGKLYSVERPNWIEVKWQDENNNFHKQRFENYQSRIIMHELDHLKGILISSIGTIKLDEDQYREVGIDW
jgi:peptide deformylase